MNIRIFDTISSDKKKERLFLSAIVLINLLLKIIPASLLELGNDEVYYWTYALFPDWSHFDHPPMVGFLIQLFTLNLRLHGEIFLRAGALVLSSAGIFILYYIVKRLHSARAAIFAVLMFVSSFYFNIISGLFILPDTPQVFFVLAALGFLLPSITIKEPSGKDLTNIVFFGIFTGLAFLSKYHSLFLWVGAGLYILIKNRIWLRKPALYLSIISTIILMIPVIYWNYMNNFISFTFHEDRVGLFNSRINLLSFARFLLGQMFYQNPVLFILFIAATVSIAGKWKKLRESDIVLLFTGLPLIILFTFFSFFHNTLPHWTGPAFICFIILASEYMADIYRGKKKTVNRTLISALIFFIVVLAAGTLQIKTGLIPLDNNNKGKNDFTLDMYGWAQAGKKFETFLEKEGITDSLHKDVALISDNWFPAAHIDYYIAHPLGIRLLALGNINRIHKYYWINQTRKIKSTDRIFYITDSRNYHGPEQFESYFNSIVPEDTITINRNKRPVKYIYIYEMKGFRYDSIPEPLLSSFSGE